MIGLAWATKITSTEQVEYRLEGACGCDVEHQDVDAQVDYRLKDDLRWLGSGLADVGLVAGEQVDKGAARALMDGRHPHQLGVDGKRLRLVEPKMAVAPAARVAAVPFVEAIRAVAEAAGVQPGEVFAHATAAARFARLERGLLRDGERHTVPIGDLEKLSAATRDVAGVAVPVLESVYSPALLAEARAHRDDRVRVDQRGTDVVLNLPKSVSALYAVVDADTAAAIEAEYMAAVTETIQALEGWASYGVSGHHGDGQVAARVDSSGFVGWSMLHRSARPVDGRVGDPHLHAHAVIAHMVRCEDGQWRAPGSGGRDIYRHVAASGELAKARVRARLSERFGVDWELDPRNNEWEIVGIPVELRTEFSARAAQIVGVAGGASAAEQRVAAAKLAEARPDVEAADVRQQWRMSAQSVVGDVEAMVAAVMPGPNPGPGAAMSGPTAGPGGPVAGMGPDGPGHGPDRPRSQRPGPGEAMAAGGPVVVPSVEEIAARVWSGEHALTAHTKAVSRVQVLTAVAAACPGGVAGVQQLEALTDAVIAAGPTIALDQLHKSHHSNTGRWTTRDIVEAEHTIATGTQQRLHAGPAGVDPVVAVATVGTWSAQRALQLSGEQLAVVERLTTGGHGVDAVIGVAGAGKTTLMAAARAVWEHAGYTVAGASTAAVASAGLAAEAGITSRTIASWLHELDQPHRPGLAGIDVLVVDEGAMVDDRALARLITAAGRSPANPTGTKVVLIGDPLQQRAIGVGGGFAAIHTIVDGAHLGENRRQRDPLERQALEAWRDGARRTALDQLAGAGRIHAVELPEQVHTEMLTAWEQARTRWAGDLHGELAGLVVLAARNADVEALNAGARAIRISAGELGPNTLYRHTAAAGGGSIALAAGDLVRVRANDYRARTSSDPDVLNGYRAVVTAVDEQRRVQIQWRTPGPDRQLSAPVWIRPEQIADGYLSHGYAMTIAASQGLTSDLTLASGVGADAHSLYPAITRARDSTHLWLARTVVEDHAVEAAQGPATDADRLARTVAAYADAIEHDRPDTLISDLLAHDQTAAQVRDILEQAHQRAAARHHDEPTAVLEEMPAADVDDAPDVDQGDQVSAPGRSLDDIVAGFTDQQRQDAVRNWDAFKASGFTTIEPDSSPELEQVTPWRQRPFGQVHTGRLADLLAKAQADADRNDAAAARIDADLQTNPAAVRLKETNLLLRRADNSQEDAAVTGRHIGSLGDRIRAEQIAQTHDYSDRSIAQAKADRPLAGLTGRHARAVEALTTDIHTRQEQIDTLIAQQQEMRETRDQRAQLAATLREQAGARPAENTDQALTRLGGQYTAEDQSNAQRADLLRQGAEVNRGTVTDLTKEIELRRQLPPPALAVEDNARTAAAAAVAEANRAAAAAAAIRIQHAAASYRPPSGPSRGPSLGR